MPVPRPICAAAFGLLALVALPAAAEPASFDFTIAGFKVDGQQLFFPNYEKGEG